MLIRSLGYHNVWCVSLGQSFHPCLWPCVPDEDADICAAGGMRWEHSSLQPQATEPGA